MSLLPDRHPNLDFFVLDIADAVPKDDMASMEHPLFSLATKPDMRHLEYRSGDNILKIRPSGLGLPTIFDKDILIFTISQLMHRKNRGEAIGDTVRFSARELSVATNRPIGGNHYKRLEDAFARLQGAQFVTNIRSGGKIETRIFSLIDEGGFVRTDDERFRLDYCEVKLSRWLMRAIESDQVVTISNDYFRLRRPLERRLYEIARKHCGSKPKWQIGLTTLQNKTGSNAPVKRFRHNLREIIKADVTPFYRFELDDADLVIVRPRQSKAQITPAIALPDWAEEKARAMAREKGRDYYALRADWLSFAQAETAKGNPPKNAGAAFVAYCAKQDSLR
ncbi:replication initiator protein A [Roseovarius mucosus]|jgi:plasmid replication initiation protein|uniref:plasmid replication initiator TrfA n=1 Tax=Roseobacteraceae TaxID=2854170 RepID=UPI000DF2BD1B|nr:MULTISPECIES: replication initiator protein A [Roseobacteraceae]MBW4976471.1 replication initiator protein A [Roseovarius mucosus]UOA30236.1 hplasmid replication protein RepA-IIe [Pseudosulfitobacter sp. DSM 107133]